MLTHGQNFIPWMFCPVYVYVHWVKFLSSNKFGLYSTCLSTWDEDRMREMRDCTPHISLFLSLRRTATVIQRPGPGVIGNIFLFLRSLWATIEKKTWKSVGAFCVRFSMSLFHSKVAYSSLEIRQKRDNGSERWLSTAHSDSNLFRNNCSTTSVRPLWSIIASASNGRWPVASAFPIALVASSSVVNVVELLDRFVTDIWVIVGILIE